MTQDKEYWRERYEQLCQIEDYFTEMLFKTSALRMFGEYQSDNELLTAAKQLELGAANILPCIAEYKEIAFQNSGAVLIPIDIQSHLTLVPDHAKTKQKKGKTRL